MKKLTLILCLVLAGCSEAPTTSQAPVKKEIKDAAIVWYDGTIESAFDLAAAEEKPIFLYWCKASKVLCTTT